MNVQLGNFLVENYARAQRTIDKFKTADEYRRDGCKVHSPFAIEENGKFMQRTTWDAASRSTNSKQGKIAVELERKRTDRRVKDILHKKYLLLTRGPVDEALIDAEEQSLQSIMRQLDSNRKFSKPHKLQTFNSQTNADPGMTPFGPTCPARMFTPSGRMSTPRTPSRPESRGAPAVWLEPPIPQQQKGFRSKELSPAKFKPQTSGFISLSGRKTSRV
jgi:hypothetical protein